MCTLLRFRTIANESPARRILAGPAALAAVVLAMAGLPGCGGDSPSDPLHSQEPGGEATIYGCVDGCSPLYQGMEVYWGDLHSHTVCSDDAAMQDPPPPGPAAALAWAADPQGGDLDFAAITDHAETVTAQEWADIRQAVLGAETSSFIPFVGFEYTNCSREPGHGHKCVLFNDPHAVPAEVIGANDAATPTELWSMLDSSDGAGNYVTVPHHPAKGIDYGANMSTDWDAPFVQPAVQPLVEIYSVHGSSETASCEEQVEHFWNSRTVEAALQLWLDTGLPGYKLGIVASTDTHKGRPGCVAETEENLAPMEGPYTGGLAALWAPSLTRSHLWQAMAAKSVYGTSGARIRLEFTAKCGSRIVPMGGTILAEAPADLFFHVRAEAEYGSSIERIEVYRNGQLLAQGTSGHLDCEDLELTGRAYYRVKVFQSPTPVVDPSHCPNERAWSSPIWVEMQ